MSTQRPIASQDTTEPQGASQPCPVEDLETTAELPALDVAAYEAAHPELTATDTWAFPAPAAPHIARPDGGAHAGSAADGSAVAAHRRLEDDLKALAANLRELEEGLAHKGERLTTLEQELEETREARSAADQRAEALSRELTDTRLALSAARGQIEELTQRLAAREAETRAVRDRNRSLEASLAARERTLARAEQQLVEVRLQMTAQLEALARREGRRAVYETMFRGLDEEAGRRESQLVQLARNLAAYRERAEALFRELAAAREQIGKLASEARSRTEAGAQALNAAADRQRELEAACAAQQSRIDALEAELAAARAQHADALAAAGAENAAALSRAEQEVRSTRERVGALEADLRAAEEAIHRLEGELRAKNARIDELTRLNDDWRSTLEAARQSLEERDALIRRLEAEAARSAALLEHIQQNVRFLDVPAAGEADAAAPTRLLIRAEGDGEVVHVLGRKTSIGRTPDNDVQIDTKFVSRHHAVILAGPAQAIIEDLNSTNGVLVNGRRVTRQSLKDGDAITVGKTQFRFAVRPAERR